MKAIKITTVLLSLIFLSYCGSDDGVKALDVPDRFTVDIPDALSSSSGTLSGRAVGDGDGIIEGNEIYESLRGFIYVGEKSAEIMEFVLGVAAEMEEADVRTFTYTSDADGREKRIDIQEGVPRSGVVYDYEMTVVDVENEDQALQLLWNANPVIGIGIINPYHLERISDHHPATFIRIDYGELALGFDAIMQVQISGLQAVENGDIDNMSLFVGEGGDFVEVIGNSNHPNLKIIDQTFSEGRNYAFVGRGEKSNNHGVVKLALPPSNIDTNDYFDTYSVFAVLEAEIQSAGINDQAIISSILAEAQSPAFFDENGFITSGLDNLPSNFSPELLNLADVDAFIPSNIRDLSLAFIR